MEYEIINLPKNKWKGHIVPIGYETKKFYDVVLENKTDGYSINIIKKDLEESIEHTPEEYNFPDRLYQDHWEDANAWGILVDEDLIAVIELNKEDWSNRMRITELWVSKEYQKTGLGHRLIEKAKMEAKQYGCRVLILETQSCNVNAIDFYRHEGFSLVGLDTSCYSNSDIENKEVRLEFAMMLK